MTARDLHVVIVHSNPKRLRVRKRLFEETAKRLEKSGAIIWRVEAAFGDRPFEVTHWWNPRHVQVRTNSEIWSKECLINLGAKRAFAACPLAETIAWIDADIQFVREDWVKETLYALDHHPVVQMFSDAIDLGPKSGFMGRAHGFARLWSEGQRPGDFETQKTKYPSHMHPGYCWAWRRKAWEDVGGMLTVGILGSGDQHMACGLVGYGSRSVWSGVHAGYREAVTEWGRRAAEVTAKNIGHVEGLILHKFHGFKSDRGYQNRVDILRKHEFNPASDLSFDGNGLPLLTPEKPGLRDDVRSYLSSRKEYDLTKALTH